MFVAEKVLLLLVISLTVKRSIIHVLQSILLNPSVDSTGHWLFARESGHLFLLIAAIDLLL